jgi:hypothetical protein
MDGLGRLSPPGIEDVKPTQGPRREAAVQIDSIYLFPVNDL